MEINKDQDYKIVNRNLIVKNKIVGSKYWTMSSNKTMSELVAGHNVKKHWANFNNIYNYGFKEKIIKPINPYVINFYPKPNLKIYDNYITLTQKTHAEIWIEIMKQGIYALDKCMQRQFYPSPQNINIDITKNLNVCSHEQIT